MNKISITTRILGIAFLGMAVLNTSAHSGSLDERFKAALNQEMVKVKGIENPDVKRKEFGNVLTRMDAGLAAAKGVVSQGDGQALGELQRKLETDYAQLNGIADGDLNRFANYVQQDVEQAAGGIYISACGLIVILVLLLILL